MTSVIIGAENVDMTGSDNASTSGCTDDGAEGESVVSLTSAQRANINELLERHAQLLMVSSVTFIVVILLVFLP